MTPAAITTLSLALIASEPTLRAADPRVITYKPAGGCSQQGRDILHVIQALADIAYYVGRTDAEWAGRVAAALHGLATHIESTRG